ncbi:MAG: HAD-IIB family hydrolase [Terriglobia bacterium]
MLPPIRLLAVDIDGTLLDTRFQVSPANRDALAAAHARGIEILLVTGRRFSFARPIATELPFDLHLIANNGALIKSKTGATFYRQLLPRALAAEILAVAAPYRAHALILFDRLGQGEVLVESLDPAHEPVAGYFARNRDSILEVICFEDHLSEDPIQVLYAGPLDQMRQLARLLADSYLADHISVALAEYPHRNFTLLDVLAPGCTNAAALAWWARRRRIRREEIMAIGDNWNDREMFEFAGLAVVMGNSSEELQRAGWLVTRSNDESGVAAAVEKYLLTP